MALGVDLKEGQDVKLFKKTINALIVASGSLKILKNLTKDKFDLPDFKTKLVDTIPLFEVAGRYLSSDGRVAIHTLDTGNSQIIDQNLFVQIALDGYENQNYTFDQFKQKLNPLLVTLISDLKKILGDEGTEV